MCLSLVWKYLGVTGRRFAEILVDPYRDTVTNRPEYEKYLTVNGLLVDTKKAEYDAKGEIRSRFLVARTVMSSMMCYSGSM